MADVDADAHVCSSKKNKTSSSFKPENEGVAGIGQSTNKYLSAKQ